MENGPKWKLLFLSFQAIFTRFWNHYYLVNNNPENSLIKHVKPIWGQWFYQGALTTCQMVRLLNCTIIWYEIFSKENRVYNISWTSLENWLSNQRKANSHFGQSSTVGQNNRPVSSLGYLLLCIHHCDVWGKTSGYVHLGLVYLCPSQLAPAQEFGPLAFTASTALQVNSYLLNNTSSYKNEFLVTSPLLKKIPSRRIQCLSGP